MLNSLEALHSTIPYWEGTNSISNSWAPRWPFRLSCRISCNALIVWWPYWGSRLLWWRVAIQVECWTCWQCWPTKGMKQSWHLILTPYMPSYAMPWRLDVDSANVTSDSMLMSHLHQLIVLDRCQLFSSFSEESVTRINCGVPCKNIGFKWTNHQTCTPLQSTTGQKEATFTTSQPLRSPQLMTPPPVPRHFIITPLKHGRHLYLCSDSVMQIKPSQRACLFFPQFPGSDPLKTRGSCRERSLGGPPKRLQQPPTGPRWHQCHDAPGKAQSRKTNVWFGT